MESVRTYFSRSLKVQIFVYQLSVGIAQSISIPTMQRKEQLSEAFFSEFFGTFFLVLTVGLNVLQTAVLAPVAIGSILMVMIFATGSVSGAHFNPAVTVGVLAAGRQRIHPVDACFYIVAQLMGALTAGAVYWWVLGATFTLAPAELKGYTWIDALVCEILFTAALVFVVLNVATTSEDSNNQYFGLAIGFTVMSSAFAIGGISGCSLNPAVTCGVMLTHLFHQGSGMTYFALYLCGPLLGALLAVGLFRGVRGAEYEKGLPA
jgi:aquaporin Z